jgi:hypothetical protein
VIYETDTKQTLVWQGSSWVMLTDADTPPGMVLVKTQTVGASVSSVTVSDCFSSTYENYKIIISGGSCNTPVDIALSLGSSSTGWYGGVMYHPFTTAGPANVAAVGLNNASYFLYAANGSSNGLSGQIELTGPYLSKITGLTTQFSVMNTSGSVVNANGIHNVATSYTSFTLTAVTGTITGGTICVYGYRNTI